ncbi:MAG: glycosyltransferase [Candidatus Tyrphobacter sp.]
MISAWPREGEPNGGACRYTKGLAHVLSSIAEVIVLADASETRDGGVIVRSAWRPPVLSARTFRAALSSLAPDVVHVQHELALYGSALSTLAFPFWLRAIARRFPTVVTVHGVVSPQSMKGDLFRGRTLPVVGYGAAAAMRVVFREIARAPALKIVHGAALADALIRYGAPAGDVAVSPIIATFKARAPSQKAARRRLGIARDAKVVLTWGFLNTYKGFDCVIDGFSLFAQSEPNAVLLFAVAPHPSLHRNGAHARELLALRGRARGMGGLATAGFISDDELATYISAADVGVFAYTREIAASGAVADTVANGTPVLLSSVFRDAPAELTFASRPHDLARRLAEFFAAPQGVIRASAGLVAKRNDERAREAHRAIYARAVARARA